MHITGALWETLYNSNAPDRLHNHTCCSAPCRLSYRRVHCKASPAYVRPALPRQAVHQQLRQRLLSRQAVQQGQLQYLQLRQEVQQQLHQCRLPSLRSPLLLTHRHPQHPKALLDSPPPPCRRLSKLRSHHAWPLLPHILDHRPWLSFKHLLPQKLLPQKLLPQKLHHQAAPSLRHFLPAKLLL